MPPTRIDGVEFTDAWRGRVEAVLVSPEGEVPIPFIGLEALVLNKRAAGRAKDLDDLSYLIKKL